MARGAMPDCGILASAGRKLNCRGGPPEFGASSSVSRPPLGARRGRSAESKRRGANRGAVLNLPNLITIARILMVPVVVWAIASREMQIAFLLFLAAGASDAVDGFLAKRFNMASELGAHLDPLA